MMSGLANSVAEECWLSPSIVETTRVPYAHRWQGAALNPPTLNWINVRDPFYFLGYGIPYIYVKRIFFLPRVMLAK